MIAYDADDLPAGLPQWDEVGLSIACASEVEALDRLGGPLMRRKKDPALQWIQNHSEAGRERKRRYERAHRSARAEVKRAAYEARVRSAGGVYRPRGPYRPRRARA